MFDEETSGQFDPVDWATAYRAGFRGADLRLIAKAMWLLRTVYNPHVAKYSQGESEVIGFGEPDQR
jgi:hypothetical protein